MSLGGGARIFSGQSRARLRKYAGLDIVVYAANTVLVQRPSMRGCGGGRLGDQDRIPLWYRGSRPSVAQTKLLWRHLGHAHIGRL